MQSKFSSLVTTLAVMVGGSMAAFGGGIIDLGPAGNRNLSAPSPTAGLTLDSYFTNRPQTAVYLVDVSKDGTLAGGTDASGNAYIWTPRYGKVTIGAGVALQGVDWLAITGVSTNVLLVGNTNGGTLPVYWQGNADGSGGSWNTLPAGDTGGWQATCLGVKADGSDWYVGGNYGSDTSEGICRYKNSIPSTSSLGLNPAAYSAHAYSFLFSVSDEETYAGRAAYGSGNPDSGSLNGIVTFPPYEAYWFAPPEAAGQAPGGGGVISEDPNRNDVSLCQGVSHDGRIIGGCDRTDYPRVWATWWTRKGGYVYSVPRLLIDGSTYATFMELHCLNYDGSVMTGIYYTDPVNYPFGGFEAFVCTRSDTTITSTNKLGDLLSAYGVNTNGWVFKDVTAMSDDANTLAGFGVTNGVIHGWLVQLPPEVIHITQISFDGLGDVLIDFTSTGIADSTASFAVQSCGTVVNGVNPFAERQPRGDLHRLGRVVRGDRPAEWRRAVLPHPPPLKPIPQAPVFSTEASALADASVVFGPMASPCAPPAARPQNPVTAVATGKIGNIAP